MYITNEAELKRRGTLTWTLVEELMELGPAQFCLKHGYKAQGKGVIFRIHSKIASATAERVQILMQHDPPEVLKQALSLLPPQGATLNDQRRELLKSLVDHAIDMAYTAEGG